MRQENVDTDRNRDTVIMKVFQKYYRDGMDTIHFSMDDIRDAIKEVARKNPITARRMWPISDTNIRLEEGACPRK